MGRGRRGGGRGERDRRAPAAASDGKIGTLETAHRQVEFVPTGIVALDHMIGGGVPIGRVIEVFGPYKSGKTLLAMEFVRAFQEAGYGACWVDAEHAFNRPIAERIGVVAKKLDFTEDIDTVEACFEFAERWAARQRRPGVFVVDSIAALGTVHEFETEMEKRSLDRAGLVYKGLRRTVGTFARGGLVMVLVNQVRERVGVYFGSPEVTPGGRGPEFFASLRLRIAQGTLFKGKKIRVYDGDGRSVGTHVIIRVEKNRFIPEGQHSEFYIDYLTGFDAMAGVLRLLAENGAIAVRSGPVETFEYRGKDVRDVDVFVDAHPELLTAIWERYRAGASAS